MLATGSQLAHRLMKYSLVGIAAVYLIHFAILGPLVGPFDFDHLSGYYELAWRFWSTGQGPLPQFNPFLCGGRPLGADPQIPIFHPLVILVPIFGATWTLKLEMLAQLALGTWGLFRLLVWLGVSSSARLWATLAFLSGGAIVARFMVGHVTLGFYFLYPLFFYLSYRLQEAHREEKWKLRLANCVLFLYAGLYKPNFLIYGVPPLLIEQAIRSILYRRVSIVAEGVLATLVCGLGNAVFLLPANEYFSQFPRKDGSGPIWVAPYSFFANLLMPLKAIPKAWYGPGFLQRHEYNIFLGPVAVFFALLSIKYRPVFRRKEFIAICVFVVVSLWIGIGAVSESPSVFLPYSWLREIWPGFKSVRVPTRFWFGCYFGILLLSAWGFRLPKNFSQGVGFLFLGLFPLFANAVVNLSKASFQATFTQWAVPRAYPESIRWESADDQLHLLRIKQGIGILHCVDNIEAFRTSMVEEGDLLKYTASAPVRGTLHWKKWGRIEVALDSSIPFSFFLNFNHSPLWKFEGADARVASRPGQPLAIQALNKSVRGDLVFETPKVRLGGAISLLTLSTLGGWAAVCSRKRRRGRHFRRIGLTGGAAAGKSEVASRFRHHGIEVIDLDAVGRKVTDADQELHGELDRLYGETLYSGGSVNRPRLRELFFQRADKRKQAEALLHPRIWKEYFEEEHKLRGTGKRIVICEAALLVEGKRAHLFDELIVVSSPQEVRKHRLMKRQGLTPEIAETIFATQTSELKRREAATVVVENHGDMPDLHRQVDRIVERWQSEGWV